MTIRLHSLQVARRVAVALTLWGASLPLAGCEVGGADSVSGTIDMAPAARAKLGASDMLFIVARPLDGAGGPPLAVLKMVGMKFPLKYTVGQEDVLMPGRFFKGKVQIQALMRRSGIVNVPAPGDLRGGFPQPVEPGATDVNIMLDQPEAVAAGEDIPASGAADAAASPP